MARCIPSREASLKRNEGSCEGARSSEMKCGCWGPHSLGFGLAPERQGECDRGRVKQRSRWCISFTRKRTLGAWLSFGRSNVQEADPAKVAWCSATLMGASPYPNSIEAPRALPAR